MHEYDTVLKGLLQSPQNSIFERITGPRIDNWLNVELPEVQQTRVDLPGETANPKRVIGLELQSTNDGRLALRMAEYELRIYRRYERFPEQYVLYVGNAEMNMPSEPAGRDFICRYKLIDIRTLDEETLLASPFDADNIIAILARHRDRRETIRRILAKIATLESGARDSAFKELVPRCFGINGLRGWFFFDWYKFVASLLRLTFEFGFKASLPFQITLCPNGSVVLDLLLHHRVEDDGYLSGRWR